MPEKTISATLIKIGGAVVMFLLSLISTLLFMLYNGQVEARKELNAAIEKVEMRMTIAETILSSTGTNVVNIQEDIRDIKIDIRELRRSP